MTPNGGSDPRLSDDFEPSIHSVVGYHVWRDDNDSPVCVDFWEMRGRTWARHMVRQVIHHSPSGMEYGFSGSGPSDLALTILAHHFGIPAEDMAARLQRSGLLDDTSGSGHLVVWRLHVPFRDRFISRMSRRALSHFITREEITDFVHELTPCQGTA